MTFCTKLKFYSLSTYKQFQAYLHLRYITSMGQIVLNRFFTLYSVSIFLALLELFHACGVHVLVHLHCVCACVLFRSNWIQKTALRMIWNRNLRATYSSKRNEDMFHTYVYIYILVCTHTCTRTHGHTHILYTVGCQSEHRVWTIPSVQTSTHLGYLLLHLLKYLGVCTCVYILWPLFCTMCI